MKIPFVYTGVCFLLFFFVISGFPETIVLKDGKEIKGRIIEKTDAYVKIEIDGVPLTYFLEDIESMQGLEGPGVSAPAPDQKPETGAFPFAASSGSGFSALSGPAGGPARGSRLRGQGQTLDKPAYLFYVPAGLDDEIKHPLIIAFSPDANSPSMISEWKSTADKYGWFIMASKKFRNGSSEDFFSDLMAGVLELSATYPIDTSQIIATGFSGGGMAAYFFAFDHPDFIRAVVSNCGRIHPAIINKQAGYGSVFGKIAVLLTGPEDFNYSHMKNDRKYLTSLGWQTELIEFKGGHTLAPAAVCEEAARRLLEQFSS